MTPANSNRPGTVRAEEHLLATSSALIITADFKYKRCQSIPSPLQEANGQPRTPPRHQQPGVNRMAQHPCPCVQCRLARLPHTSLPTRAQTWLAQQPPHCFHSDDLIRQHYIAAFGFAVLDQATVQAIRPFAPLIEAGAGTGYWAWELQEAGINIVATDPNPKTRWPNIPTWTSVLPLSGPDAIRLYPHRNLLVCWPDQHRPWAAHTALACQAQFLLYVGETENGCTATPEFFQALTHRYSLVRTVPIPQFAGQADQLRIYRLDSTPNP